MAEVSGREVTVGGETGGRFLMDFVSVCVDGSESVRKAGRGGVAV